jgi:hypothetical protein
MQPPKPRPHLLNHIRVASGQVNIAQVNIALLQKPLEPHQPQAFTAKATTVCCVRRLHSGRFARRKATKIIGLRLLDHCAKVGGGLHSGRAEALPAIPLFGVRKAT